MSGPSGNDRRLAYRLNELAPLIGVPKSTLHDAVRTEKIRSVRLGRVILIPAAEVERLLGSQ
jgi:excisionase family DNA binding protein